MQFVLDDEQITEIRKAVPRWQQRVRCLRLL